MTANPIVEHLRKTQDSLRRKIEDLRRSIEKPIAEVERDLEHIAGTIAFLEREQISPRLSQAANQSVEILEVVVPRLAGKTHVEAIVAIAKANGGLVRAQDAKRLMIRAGVMRNTRNSTHMTHNAILRSGLFERIAPGEFVLKSHMKQPKPGPETTVEPEHPIGAVQ
jgi:hypothetical protein